MRKRRQVVEEAVISQLHNRSESESGIQDFRSGLGSAGELFFRTHLDEPHLHLLNALEDRRCLVLLHANRWLVHQGAGRLLDLWGQARVQIRLNAHTWVQVTVAAQTEPGGMLANASSERTRMILPPQPHLTT